MNITYLPMTAEIITVGHIRVIKQLAGWNDLIVGLLDEKALEGYKDVVVSFKDRKEILESIGYICKVVRQSSLNPYKNLTKYHITHVASGDGWEPEEIEAIEKAGCEVVNVRLKGEKEGQKLYSATKIYEAIKSK